MSISVQPNVNVLNGSLASGFNNGRPTGDNERIKSIPNNALQKPTFDVAEDAPPFGNAFNGVTYWGSPLGNWCHFGQLYTSSGDYATFTGNNWLANFPAYKDLGGVDLDDQRKVLKLYGAGTNFPLIVGPQENDYNGRGSTDTNIPLVGMSENGPAGSFPDSGSWCRHEWIQGVDVSLPGGGYPTYCTFGAYIRVPENDDFRAKNCGGIYLYNDVSPVGGESYINAIVVKKDSDSMSLLTGTQTNNLTALQNWSGLNTAATSEQGETPFYGIRKNSIVHIESIDYENSSDFRQFKKVQKTVNMNDINQTQTVGIGLFFGENQSNLDESGTPTGAIHFYNPFIVFSNTAP